jgi:hypothetical protein
MRDRKGVLVLFELHCMMTVRGAALLRTKLSSISGRIKSSHEKIGKCTGIQAFRPHGLRKAGKKEGRKEEDRKEREENGPKVKIIIIASHKRTGSCKPINVPKL